MWAGTQQKDYLSQGLPEVMPDGFGLMRSTDPRDLDANRRVA